MDHKSESIVLLSIDVDRFMTSEGTDTFILAITSKTGQSVARNTHKIFLFGFVLSERHILFERYILSERYIKGFYRPNFRLQT